MSLEQWSLVVVVSILAGLDRTAVASTMLARPLVCATLLGFVLGVFTPALQLGVMLELLWLMRLPVGAAVAPDDTQAVLAAVVLIKLYSAQLPQHHWELIIFVGLLVVVLAELGKCFDVWARHINERLFLAAQHDMENAHWRSMSIRHYSGLLVFAGSSLLSLAAIIAIGSTVLTLGLDYIDEVATLFPVHGELLKGCFPVVGAAATLAVLRVKHSVVLFVCGYAVVFMLLEVV